MNHLEAVRKTGFFGVVGLMGLLGAGSALADNAKAEQLVAQGLQCSQITTAIERLDCFDRLFTKDSGKLSAQAQGQAAAQAAASKAAVAAPADAAIEQAFPARAANGSEANGQEAPVLHATVTAAEKAAYGKYYLTLDNGHVWREKEKSRFRYKAGTKIRIEKGALGANNLYVEDKAGFARVERVK
ncbi:hypothetical protein L1F30_13235 [Simiduia sp. 21SJ11W-1]|uniref:hypothetical protein n=1 Tax=Simiduia sp. 21SJ11W-1 TaxID=2909669 RepID=UPI00209EC29B|nr:hypothetical protein [Simiduia sp. 21SJ11W-1]UTA47120.1 hypothetical protein L1F30_13235 [Simiduia sp. 21SJ11W-1]